jgi:hypothetical protein
MTVSQVFKTTLNSSVALLLKTYTQKLLPNIVNVVKTAPWNYSHNLF